MDIDGFGPNDLASFVNVSRETIATLEEIVDELDVWRHKSNLIGPSEFQSIWRRHVLDSLQLIPLLPRSGTVLDLGSGAGFPALILASYAKEMGDIRVVMVESVGRKCAFLRAAIERANLPATVMNTRVETLSGLSAECVTARAFAPLPKLLSYAEPWLSKGAFALLPKGRRWQEELTSAKESWRFVYEAIPSKTSSEAVILKVSEVSRG